jgi:hypothetical protein
VPDIRASAEVRALIGAENVAELEKDAFASFRCRECGLLGTTAEPTSVVARRFRRTVVVDLAHAECMRSLVDDVDADPPPGLGLDDGRADMRVMTLVLEYPAEPKMRPLLLLERRIEAARFTVGGEKINVTLAALLRRGLEPVRSAGQLPGLARGWRLRRPDRFTALLLGRDGEVVYRGACAQPDDWVRLVDAAGVCVVLVGTIGLYAIPEEGFTAARTHHLLDRAALAGTLAGGLIACWPGDVPGAGHDPPAAELAGRIRRGWARHHR